MSARIAGARPHYWAALLFVLLGTLVFVVVSA